MDCGIPFCHSGTAGCPLGNLIPRMERLGSAGRWDAASDRLHATNNFPEFTGRLCPAPCEAACVLSIADEKTGGSVTIKRIEQTIADQAWMDGVVEPQPAAIATGKRVAVVGSGPAGLAAAQQLTRAGHHVTVYERDDRLGGLMRYGIPEYKLEKAMLNQRLAQMRAEGTRFVTDCEVGVDLTVEQLREQHDAVVLAVGALRARDNEVRGPPSRRRAPRDGASGARQQGVRGRRPVAAVGQGQARRDHRRRRHRRGLPRHRASPGRRVGDAARLQPGTAGVPRRVPLAVADVAAGAAHVTRRTPRAGRGATRSRCSGSSATTTGRVRAMQIAEVRVTRDADGRRQHHPGRRDHWRFPASSPCSRSGSTASSRWRCSTDSDWNSTGAGRWRAGRTGRPPRPACSSAVTPTGGVADRLGDRGGPQRGARGRRVPDGRIRSAGTGRAQRVAAGRRVTSSDRDYAEIVVTRRAKIVCTLGPATAKTT